MRSKPVLQPAGAPVSPIGRRVHVIGNAAAGKSTLAKRLAAALDAEFVELDALNWLPGWVGLNETDPDELTRRIERATQGDAWVAAGYYTRFAQPTFWQRLDTVIWLDLPAPLLVWRVLRRAWRRWRTKELIHGNNVERFWPHLAFWDTKNSLVHWVVRSHRGRRAEMLATMADPRWAHIHFIRLTSRAEIDTFATAMEAEPMKAAARRPRE